MRIRLYKKSIIFFEALLDFRALKCVAMDLNCMGNKLDLVIQGC